MQPADAPRHWNTAMYAPEMVSGKLDSVRPGVWLQGLACKITQTSEVTYRQNLIEMLNQIQEKQLLPEHLGQTRSGSW